MRQNNNCDIFTG